MSKTIVRKQTYAKSLGKGVLAGLIGGLVAIAAKSVTERFYPPLPHDDPDPRALPAEALNSHELVVLPKPAAQTHWSVDWSVDALAGAAYGAVAEFYPAATAKDGAGFGFALGSLKQDGALAALGLAPATAPHNIRERAREMTKHVVFGMVTETVRRVVRRILA